ncbi:MAG: replication restart helicase PriA, partial [Pseudomonadales bacterium]
KYPGLIVIDEEHDPSFKQQEGFHYNARDLAVLRGQLESVPVVLGSATPSLESIANARQGRYQRLELTRRPASFQQESYDFIDTSQLPVTDGISDALRQRIADTLNAGEQALLFINRRGYAPALLCNSCGWIAECRRCDARLTYHLRAPGLYCHHCGSHERPFDVCGQCESKSLVLVGTGTQRVEQRLAGIFAGSRILRIDRDSARKAQALEKMFREVAQGDPAILVGTQLLAKGHHFPNVTLVALLDIDGAFYTSDFRALERLGQTILQVGGRAGRESKPGRVAIQTRFAAHPLLKLLIEQGYSSFADQLLDERRKTGLPPYSYHALIRASSIAPQAAIAFLEDLAGADPSGKAQVLGPVPALMEKKAGRHRQLLLLSAKKRSHLHDILMLKVGRAEGSKLARKVRWTIDVDPYDLF